MSKNKLVWDDEKGDLRKIIDKKADVSINEKNILLNVRRLTAGKGRTVIEVSNLPQNKKWCEDLAKTLKKTLGVGGTYKNNYIEVHSDKIENVTQIFDQKMLKWKKIGG